MSRHGQDRLGDLPYGVAIIDDDDAGGCSGGDKKAHRISSLQELANNGWQRPDKQLTCHCQTIANLARD